MLKEIEYCNLLQACEWIAFGYIPMAKLYSEAQYGKRPELIADGFDEANWIGAKEYLNPPESQKEYARHIYAARDKLVLAIYEHAVTVFGATKFQQNIHKLGEQYIKDVEIFARGKDLTQDELYMSLKNAKKISKITDFSEIISVNLIDNTLQSGTDVYFDTCVFVADLKTAFPRKSKVAAEISKMTSNNAKCLKKKEKLFLDTWEKDRNKILNGKKYDIIIDNIVQLIGCSVNTAKKYYKKYIK